MVVMEDLTAQSINKEVGKAVENTASVITDGHGLCKIKRKNSPSRNSGRTKQNKIRKSISVGK